jgi:cysteine desulfurase/selenocysteine lyase
VDVQSIRNSFPFFRDSDKIYLDNASTTQKPDEVIEAVNKYMSEASNVGRGEYTLSFKNSEKVDASREKLANFIGADKQEIVFTSGATDSLNMIPEIWGEHNLEDGDEILVSAEAHKSAKLPWYSLKERLNKKGVNIEVKEYRLRTDRQPNYGDIRQKVYENTRLISLTHIHNSYGSKTDIEKVKSIVNDKTLISLDACQSISHSQIDVKKLEVDFLSFSGHKMFANTGVGVLFIDESIHEMITPQRKGGGKKDRIPYSLEPGTPNISGVISIGAATDFVEKIGIDEIQKRMKELNEVLYRGIKEIEGLTIFSPSNAEGPLSFKTERLSSKEIGMYLDEQDILVRTGDHCSTDQETVRVSPHFYNTEEEIEELVKKLQEVL